MTGLTFQTSFPLAAQQAAAARAAARPAAALAALAAAPAPDLTRAEQARIADAFPERPLVAQRLYGPTRQTHTAPLVGARLDLSA